MTRRTSPCPGCSIHDLTGPELARGDCCECGFASCREPHCPSEPSRCVELSADEPEVWFCSLHCPPLCADCGDVAVPREGLWCAECWAAEQPAIIRGARLLLPVLAHMMAWRRRHYEPRVPSSVLRDPYRRSQPPTVPAPDAEASEAVGPMSIATAYTLIRRTGGLALIVGLA